MRLKLVFLISLFATVPAWAVGAALPVTEQAILSADASANDLIPLEKVFAMLRKSYSGDKLDARIRQGANTTYYEVHWLTAEGRKLVFLVNAYSGKIEETRGSAGGQG